VGVHPKVHKPHLDEMPESLPYRASRRLSKKPFGDRSRISDPPTPTNPGRSSAPRRAPPEARRENAAGGRSGRKPGSKIRFSCLPLN
jgi:hypothetical protein